MDIEQWGTTLMNLSFCTSLSVREFPTSVECFHEITTNCLKSLAQLAKKMFSYSHDYAIGVHNKYYV